MAEERIPPQNLEAEQAVLGAMLIENDAIAKVAEILNSDDFYREAHRVIFAAMLSIAEKHEAVDLVTVTDALRTLGKLDDVGGIAYVTGLANAVPTAANVVDHAKIVEEKSTLRKMIGAATEIAASGYEQEGTVEETVDRAEARILEIANRKKKTDFIHIAKVVDGTSEEIIALVENRISLTGIPTGFVDFDKMTAGLHPSDFIIIAARPSMGKTALALNMVQNIAIRDHRKSGAEQRCIAIFSLEMSKEQLVRRMICSEGNIDSQALRVGELTEQDLDSFWIACDELNKAKIFIDDTATTVMEMRHRTRRLKAEHGLDMIVIDYLQLMSGSIRRNTGDRQQEVSEISRSLKALAREMDVPVVALSQLSRSVENRTIKRPMLSDLRESGSLEQDADVVAFLYREDYYVPDTDLNNVAELIIAKHRNGPTGTVNLFFHKNYAKFVSLARPDPIRRENPRR